MPMAGSARLVTNPFFCEMKLLLDDMALGVKPLGICHNSHSPRSSGDALRQANVPPFLALVHTQDNAGASRRMVGRCVEEEKTRPQLGHGDGESIEQKMNADLGRVTAVTA